MNRDEAGAGLCVTCTYCHRITNARASTFFLCRRAESDASFSRYPRLPVVDCRGYQPATADNEA